VQERTAVPVEFHVSRRARDRYRFDDALFSLRGHVLLADFHAARLFARRMNEQRDLVRYPERAVRAGQINALGLIDEIAHFVVHLYRQQRNPRALEEALHWLYDHVGRERTDEALRRFADQFPPLAVYRREIGLDDYFQGQTEGTPNRLILLEEMLMLWLTNENPACHPFLELFDDADLARTTAYPQMMAALHDFFDTQPPFGPDNQNLIDMLRAPALAHPHSLADQLEFIRRRWGSLLGTYFYRLLGGLDLIAEEEKAAFLGPGPAPVYEYDAGEAEPERFSPDRDWMPTLVLLAKNTYVWLDQLSKQYKRDIHRLDQVPDEELDTLARRGFTGLWLIGVWERSPASRKIKQLCGNPEAVASAYSLYDYVIAADLGGPEAYRDLRDRAWQRGIRLACDMVPNHVGIYSKWVVEHPDWFIALDHSPFPSYTFNGPDLSEDERVGIFLEDHYYDRSDAAVVFKRLDRRTGEELYIYHGNDGTAMPWNDTAQLNYLKAEVREAVIQTILHVARRFPIIRFDAAMTLTKKHFQRLWFPEPGSGGAIPSRAEHGLTREQFDAAMPHEFWREVVDRVAAEAPDTLLLAEAFWLLEGYFVRTLGMHRVYNSAFMHMLRDEDNAKYRRVMKNTLEFDPEILKRFVNFMNNPDEETAVAQFGKGDKYFGVCTLLATLPGLPMFGHGQVEGLAEKYGMEYRRAYWDEQPDPWLVERHERQIFPLLHRRHLFAEVRNFVLYDFVTAEGVNEDVFAYSNRAGEERALVVYHNRFATTQGRIKDSVAFSVKGKGGERRLVRRTLAQGLGLRAEEGLYYRFRDHVTGLEYLRSGQELTEQGLYVALDAYRCHVFLDWQEVQDDEQGRYRRLAAYLGGRGVPSIEEALQEVALQPVLIPFRRVVNAELWRQLTAHRAAGPEAEVDAALLEEAESRMRTLLGEVQKFSGGAGDPAAIAAQVRRELAVALTCDPPEPAGEYTLLGWLFTHSLGRIVGEEGAAARSRSWLDAWFLGRRLAAVFGELGLDEEAARWAVGTVKMLVGQQGSLLRAAAGTEPEGAYRLLVAWLRDGDVQQFLQINRYGGVLWFNHEAFGQLLDWMETLAVIQVGADPALHDEEKEETLTACRRLLSTLREAEAKSGYQVVRLIEGVRVGGLVDW